MKTGVYITNRLLPEFVRAAAERYGIRCTSMSDDWVLRLERDLQLGWVLGYQFDLNTAAASGIAQDKVATHLALREAGVPSVEHVLLRSLQGEPFPAEKLAEMFSGPFVIKPLDGTGGRDVMWVKDVSAAEKVIAKSQELTWAASPLLEITAEYRVIMLDGTSIVIYEKTQPVTERGLRYYNLGKGAKPAEVLAQGTKGALETLARRACAVLKLRLASVDIVRVDGNLLVLEVNDGIMMEYYARHSTQYKKNAALAYEAIVTAMFQ
jgi:glutathione synthase/RimK-type ligase-like ATP-grasp enzyme